MSTTTIGIKIADRTYFPILEKGTSSRKRLVLTTVKDNQQSVQIDLYENDVEEMQSANYVGSLLIENIEGGPAGGAEVELVLAVDDSGSLTASASEATSGETQSLHVSLESIGDNIYDVPEFELDSGLDTFDENEQSDDSAAEETPSETSLDAPDDGSEELSLTTDDVSPDDFSLDAPDDVADGAIDEVPETDLDSGLDSIELDAADESLGELPEDFPDEFSTDDADDGSTGSIEETSISLDDSSFDSDDSSFDLDDSSFDLDDSSGATDDSTDASDDSSLSLEAPIGDESDENEFELGSISGDEFEGDFGSGLDSFGDLDGDESPDGGEEYAESYDSVGPQEQAAIVERKRPLMLGLFIAFGVIAIVLVALILFQVFEGPKVPPLEARGGDPTTQVAASDEASSSAAGGGPAVSSTGDTSETSGGEIKEAFGIPIDTDAMGGTWYWVRTGDTLAAISTSFYKNPRLYGLIADHNQIPNPDLIFAGSRIYIPAR